MPDSTPRVQRALVDIGLVLRRTCPNNASELACFRESCGGAPRLVVFETWENHTALSTPLSVREGSYCKITPNSPAKTLRRSSSDASTSSSLFPFLVVTSFMSDRVTRPSPVARVHSRFFV